MAKHLANHLNSSFPTQKRYGKAWGAQPSCETNGWQEKVIKIQAMNRSLDALHAIPSVAIHACCWWNVEGQKKLPKQVIPSQMILSTPFFAHRFMVATIHLGISANAKRSPTKIPKRKHLNITNWLVVSTHLKKYYSQNGNLPQK